jgi:hypothetical protein
VHQVGPKDYGSQNFSFLDFIGTELVLRQISATATATARDRRKTWKSAIIFFHFSRHETNTSLIFHMWQVKNSDFTLFPIQDPRVKVRFEVLFKKFHPRINMTTLFITTILKRSNHFQAFGALTAKFQKTSLKLLLSLKCIKLAQMRLGDKIQLSNSKGEGCRRDTNFVSYQQRRVTDGFFLSLKSCFSHKKSLKVKISNIFFHFSRH